MESMQLVQIWTDGACKRNPGGHGGWGALNSLAQPCKVVLCTDSRYVIDSFTKWLKGWERRGWTTKEGQPVKNLDLWQAMIEAVSRHEVEWQWVKGHNDHPENERADWLANQGVLMDPVFEIPTDRRLFTLPDALEVSPCAN